MSYIGNEPPDTGAYGVQSFDGGGTSFTLSKPSTTATVLLFIDGVRQTPVDAYSVSGVTLTTTATTPSGTDNVTVQFLGDVVDFGEPSDDSVSTAKIQDDAVTAAKLANSINTEIAANTAKVTNATHTGDVTGATALTIANDAVDIAMLSATGTASATTYLRGDNAWSAISGGLSDVSIWRLNSSHTISAGVDTLMTNWEEDDTSGAGRVGSAMTESSGIFTFPSTGFWLITYYFEFGYNGATRYAAGRIYRTLDDSSYDIVAYQNQFAEWSGDSAYGGTSSSFIFDVTDTAQRKVKFTAFSPQAIVVSGESTKNRTAILFMKLGAT